MHRIFFKSLLISNLIPRNFSNLNHPFKNFPEEPHFREKLLKCIGSYGRLRKTGWQSQSFQFVTIVKTFTDCPLLSPRILISVQIQIESKKMCHGIFFTVQDNAYSKFLFLYQLIFIQHFFLI